MFSNTRSDKEELKLKLFNLEIVSTTRERDKRSRISNAGYGFFVRLSTLLLAEIESKLTPDQKLPDLSWNLSGEQASTTKRVW